MLETVSRYKHGGFDHAIKIKIFVDVTFYSCVHDASENE